ncbi:TIGR01777 family oxidoreductase, partial [Desulfomarina sp.]
SSAEGISPGTRARVKIHTGPLSLNFEALHVEENPGQMFRDIQEKGPFAHWSHTHIFHNSGDETILEDRIEYGLVGHRFIPAFIRHQIENKLTRLFRHRQQILTNDIALHGKYSRKQLNILVTGAGGMLGRSLLPFLTTGGHRVWRLVRRRPSPDKNEIFWDPEKNYLQAADLPPLDAVIHLAGEPIGLCRWNEKRKTRVLRSRTAGTMLLSQTLAKLQNPPSVLLSASAVGYYGDCGHDPVSEDHSPGEDFIARVCHRWEESTLPARQAGIRTVLMRIGVTLSPKDGALKRILSTAPLGFMRHFGSGDQYISWICEDDLFAAMLHTLVTPALEGPVNMAAPHAVTNKELMSVLSTVTGRPLLFPMPGRLFEIMYGQMAREVILSGCRVSTEKLEKTGFVFNWPTIEPALRYLLGKDRKGNFTQVEP